MPENSFDVVSRFDMQEVQNAVHQAEKEIRTRYDFKGSKSTITLEPEKIVIVADDEFKRKAVQEVLESKLVKRGVPLKALTYGKPVEASHATIRQEVELQQGIATDKAKEIVKAIKDAKKKGVQASIQGDQVRITGKSRDDLQSVIALLKSLDFGIALQFTNYRG